MKIGLIFTILVLMAGSAYAWPPARLARQAFDKHGYYSVLESGSLAGIDSELSVLKTDPPKEQEAFEGTLLMKKASLLGRPKEKLHVFRSGAVKLEAALAGDSSNAEYHFLRLIIQEHAPGFLHYNKDMEKDSQCIYRSFKDLSPVVRKAIIDYSKHSKLLRAKELNG